MKHDLNAMARSTPAGMAGIAGTGPAGTTCRSCAFWGGNQVYDRAAGVLKPTVAYRRWVDRPEGGQVPLKQACHEYRRIRRGQLDPSERSARVGPETPSCSRYREFDTPQDAYREKETVPASTEGSEVAGTV